MKNYFIVLAMLAMQPLFAQIKLFEKPSPEFSKAIETILHDFPHNYKNIEGELLEADLEYEHYASRVNIPGAEYCVIGRYHSVRDTSASWQALMYRSEEFEAAAKEYRLLFKKLKGSQIGMVDGSKLYLNGDLDQPHEEMDFIVSTLVFKTMDRRYRDFKVELEMLYKMNEWVININIITRQKDSEVRPDWMSSGG